MDGLPFKSIAGFKERQIFEGVSALELYDSAISMLERYYKREVVNRHVREANYLVPEKAYREAVANALVHRVWYSSAMIRIAMHDDKIYGI